jgi:hypothetical protein
VGGELGTAVGLEDVRYSLDGLLAVECLVGERCGWDWALQCLKKGLCGLDGDFSGSRKRHFDGLRKKFDRIRDSFSSGLGDVYAIASIMFGCWAKVPPFDAMRIP